MRASRSRCSPDTSAGALDCGAALELIPGDTGAWRTAFDQVADELRAALSWAADDARYRPQAHRLAIMLADLCFARGLLAESQRRYEQAAELAPDDSAAAAALRDAAGAAETRHFGTEAMRLRRAAADAALRAGDRAGAAADLARSAELINRGPGLMATAAPRGAVEALIAEARSLAGDDPVADARILVAEAFNGAEADPATTELIDRALTLARRVGDPLIESAALDQLTAVQLARGEVRAAAASALRRTELLTPKPVTAGSGLEFFDAFSMATDGAIAAGDLPAARQLAERARDLPFHREEGHLATARLIVVCALAGDWDEALVLARPLPRGMGAGGTATRRQPQPRRLRRGDRPRVTRGRRRPSGLAAYRRRPRDAGTAAVTDPLRRILRRIAAAAPGPPATGDAPVGHATGAVPGLAQRHVAAVVRRAVG